MYAVTDAKNTSYPDHFLSIKCPLKCLLRKIFPDHHTERRAPCFSLSQDPFFPFIELLKTCIYTFVFFFVVSTSFIGKTLCSERSGTLSILFVRLHQDLGFTRHLGHSYYVGEPVLCFTPYTGHQQEFTTITKSKLLNI